MHIIFADRHLVVVSKPAGLLTASDHTRDETLLELVRRWNAETLTPGAKGYLVPIHFLDRPVSGIIMFARSSKAATRLNAAMRERRIFKEYLAVVEGQPPGKDGLLEHLLVKDRKSNATRVAKPGEEGAKSCVLEYEVLVRTSQKSLLRVLPKTGRSHQIRVQLSAAGLPICGDLKYGASAGRGSAIALHALRLTFEHPVEKRPLRIEAPLPESWNEYKEIISKATL